MPAIHKQELKKIWQSAGAGREALTEELNYVTFSLEAFYNEWKGSVAASRTGNKLVAQCDEAIHVEDDFVVADSVSGIVLRIDRDYNILWEWTCPLGGVALGLDYSADLDRVLVDAGVAVYELNASTGAQVNSLSTVGGKTFLTAAWTSVMYDKLDPSTFYIANWRDRVIWRTNWAGIALWTFGTYGTATANVNRPLTANPICLATSGHERKIIVGDRGLSLFQQIDVEESSVDWRVPCWLEPRVFMLPNNFMALTLGHERFALSYLLEPAETSLAPAYILPPSATTRGDPSNPWRLLLMTRWGFVEIDLRRWRNIAFPRDIPLWTGSTIGTGGSSIPGLMDWFYDEVVVALKSDQPGRLYIDRAPILRLVDGYWDGSTWDNIVEEPVQANKLKEVYLEKPLGIGRVRFVPDAEATVYGWWRLA